jgi:peptide deformylase
MAVRTILKMGDSRLLRRAQPVSHFGTTELRELVEDMFDTMRAADGAGLAAPQIGVSLRVLIFGFERNLRYPEAPPVPETVLINPFVEAVTNETETGWEGCLSVPGMRGAVPRYTQIRYGGFDISGNPLQRSASGFHARVVQHEFDHLEGVLYPQRIRDMTKFGFASELPLNGALEA